MDKRAFDCWITCNYGNLIARQSRDEMLDEDCLQEAYLLTVGTRGFVPYEEYPLLLLRNYRRAKKRSVAHSFLHIHPDPLFFEFLHEEEGRLEETNGESELAGKQFFSSDSEFRPAEFMHFCSKMLIKEPKQTGKSPCMVLFCEYEQQFKFIELGRKYGLMHYIPLVFRKNFSAQVLKANMKIVGNCEYGLVLYRDRLPKFNNHGRMIFNCFDWVRDNGTPKVHPTQKPVPLLETLIDIFTDPGDVVIDPCAGSGTTLLAAANLERKAYGFEVNKKFYNDAKTKILPFVQRRLFL